MSSILNVQRVYVGQTPPFSSISMIPLSAPFKITRTVSPFGQDIIWRGLSNARTTIWTGRLWPSIPFSTRRNPFQLVKPPKPISFIPISWKKSSIFFRASLFAFFVLNLFFSPAASCSWLSYFPTHSSRREFWDEGMLARASVVRRWSALLSLRGYQYEPSSGGR